MRIKVDEDRSHSHMRDEFDPKIDEPLERELGSFLRFVERFETDRNRMDFR